MKGKLTSKREMSNKGKMKQKFFFKDVYKIEFGKRQIK